MPAHHDNSVSANSTGSSIDQAEKGNYSDKFREGASLRVAVTDGGHPVDNSQPALPVYHRKIANPAPLGLSAFALTTFVLSLINIGAGGVKTPNILVALCFGYGGTIQVIAGIIEAFAGNTFGLLVFSSYGGFWLSYGLVLSPWSGISAAYMSTTEFKHAVGFYLIGWAIFTLIVLAAALRSSIALLVTVTVLETAFWLLAVSEFVDNPMLKVAGGYLGIMSAFGAWYIAAATVITPDTSYFVLPIGDLSRGRSHSD